MNSMILIDSANQANTEIIFISLEQFFFWFREIPSDTLQDHRGMGVGVVAVLCGVILSTKTLIPATRRGGRSSPSIG